MKKEYRSRDLRMWGDGMTEKDLIFALKAKVEAEFRENADELIEKLVDNFRSELLRKKNSIIAGMINGLEILVNQEIEANNITFQIHLTSERGDKK